MDGMEDLKKTEFPTKILARRWAVGSSTSYKWRYGGQLSPRGNPLIFGHFFRGGPHFTLFMEAMRCGCERFVILVPTFGRMDLI